MKRRRTDTAVETTRRPETLDGIDSTEIVEVDVRDDLRSGREPFKRIMAARQRMPEGGALMVRAIFEPVPLYAVLGKQGFDHFTEELGHEDWRVWFYPAEKGPATPKRITPAEGRAADDELGTGVIVLDVRDMEPPEPMVRTLAALEALPPGGTLLQINLRVPQFLLPQLQERGFSYEVREQEPNLVRVFIRRTAAG